MVTIDTGVLFANLPNRLGHHLVSCHLLLILGSANLGFALHRWQDDVCGARVEDHPQLLLRHAQLQHLDHSRERMGPGGRVSWEFPMEYLWKTYGKPTEKLWKTGFF